MDDGADEQGDRREADEGDDIVRLRDLQGVDRGMKYQLSRVDATRAPSNAGPRPPTSVVTTTATSMSSTSPASPTEPPTRRRTAVSNGGSTAPSAKPRPRRSAESGGWLVARRSGARPGRGTTWRSRVGRRGEPRGDTGGRHTHDSGERSSRAGWRAPTTTVCAWTAVATSHGRGDVVADHRVVCRPGLLGRRAQPVGTAAERPGDSCGSVRRRRGRRATPSPAYPP